MESEVEVSGRKSKVSKPAAEVLAETRMETEVGANLKGGAKMDVETMGDAGAEASGETATLN